MSIPCQFTRQFPEEPVVVRHVGCGHVRTVFTVRARVQAGRSPTFFEFPSARGSRNALKRDSEREFKVSSFGTTGGVGSYPRRVIRVAAIVDIGDREFSEFFK